MSKLVLIDGNAILHRAYHALPPLTNKSGEPINAVYGFVSMLLRIIQDLKPSHIAVCFDRKEPTFRHLEFKAYQAQRPKMEDNLSTQFGKAKEVITAFNIPIFEMVGYEADDLIGTIARKGEKDMESVIIVTGDRDILQLVSNKTRVYLPIKGLSEAKLFAADDVIEKMGVVPELIPDYKALVGDPSDNYPGVAGIGPKTAVSLLNTYKSVDNIYKNLKEIPAAIRDKLEKGRESARLSHKLATIVCDIPIELSLSRMSSWSIDNPKVLDLFSKIGFKTLTKRVIEVGKNIQSENQMTLV